MMNTQESRRYLGAALATLVVAAGNATAWGAPPARAAKPQTQTQSYGMGTLSMAQGQYQFYPQGCLHNGNRAVCSFVAVYSGANQSNVNAWAGYGGQWTQNVQFVDNAHVPHPADTAYFMDSFGARQPTLFIQQGTQASITVEFPNVDPAVTAGEFHLGNQIVGGIAVNQVNYAAPPSNMNAGGAAPQPMMPQQPTYNGAAPAAPANMPQQQFAMQQPQQQSQQCTPQNANSALCRANDKVNGATTQVASMTQSAQVLSGTLKSLFGKSTPAAAPAAAPAPQQQYVPTNYPQQQQPPYPQQQQQYPQGQYPQQQAQYPQGQYPQQQAPQYPQQQPQYAQPQQPGVQYAQQQPNPQQQPH